MDIEKFRKSSSGKIIKAGQGDAAYWSYIPNPLPPELAFDHELIRALSDADRSLVSWPDSAALCRITIY